MHAALWRAGHTVSKPIAGNCAAYDCIADRGDRLLRVQIKTGWQDGDVVRWATRSKSYYGVRTYHGAADVFGVWVPETRKAYLVPVELCGRSEGGLRLAPTRNGQVRGALPLASDFELR